ncbi:MAG: hypothetical protein OEM00_11265 [Burkholderiaceae bacterium]|nr:hypothetical protein [Burkholderiaceae bacterium]
MNKRTNLLAAALGALVSIATAVAPAYAAPSVDPHHSAPNTPGDLDNFDVIGAQGIHSNSVVSFRQVVRGVAGGTVPTSHPGQPLDGAEVLGYVFPTTLKSTGAGDKP